MRRQALATLVFLCAAGALAGLVAEGARRPPPLPKELRVHEGEFALERPAADPFVVRPEKWLEKPELRADFDLVGDVELGAGATLDLLLRRMEPHSVQGVNLGFHGRFTVLRLSTRGEGPAWRTPEQALLGPETGVALAPGLPATLKIEARGRQLTANVAGRALPTVLAQDEIGSLAFAARGGPASIASLHLVSVPAAPAVPPWLEALAAGLVAGALALARRAAWSLQVLAAAALVLGALAARSIVFARLPPLAEPDARDEMLVALAGAPLALVCCIGGRAGMALALLGALVGGSAAWWGSQRVAERFPPTPQLDELFGPASRQEVAESLARRVRGPMQVHVLDQKRRFVFLLGGQLLYRRGPAPDQHVEALLLGELRRALGATGQGGGDDVEIASLPTEDGFSAQQWRLFTTCFLDYRPRVLVFGVPRDEAVPDPVSGVPRSSPTALRATLEQVQAHARAHAAALVLLADSGLAPELLAVVRAAAAGGVPLCELAADASPLQVAQQLAAAIAPLLRP